MIWFLAFAAAWVLVAAVAWSWFAIAAPETVGERREEDDTQAAFLRESSEEHA